MSFMFRFLLQDLQEAPRQNHQVTEAVVHTAAALTVHVPAPALPVHVHVPAPAPAAEEPDVQARISTEPVLSLNSLN